MGNRIVAVLGCVIVVASSLPPPARAETDPRAEVEAGAPRDALPEQSTPPPANLVYVPAPAPAPPTPFPPDYRSRGEVSGPMIGGIVLIGAGYSLSLITGIFAVLIGEAGSACERCTPYGRWMFLPVVGPWVSMARESETRPGRTYAGVLGASQSLGLLLIGIGAIVGNGRREPPPVAFGIRPDGVDLTIRF